MMMLIDAKYLCESVEMNSILYSVKNILKLILIISPILAIISMTLIFFQLMNNPDNNKLIKKLVNSIKALIIVFFIPFLGSD